MALLKRLIAALSKRRSTMTTPRAIAAPSASTTVPRTYKPAEPALLVTEHVTDADRDEFKSRYIDAMIATSSLSLEEDNQGRNWP
jgi:hypothetical protein